MKIFVLKAKAREMIKQVVKGQLVIARELRQTTLKLELLWGIPGFSGQNWTKERIVVNLRQSHEWPRLTDAHGKQSLTHVV